MSKYHLSAGSKEKMQYVHPDLIAVVEKAITLSDVDFCVVEGRRSEERQRVLVKSGASGTMRSRHLTGHAVDLVAWVDGRVDWSWALYYKIAKSMKIAANILEVPLEWGGDWKTFKDGPHFQLPWSSYAITKEV